MSSLTREQIEELEALQKHLLDCKMPASANKLGPIIAALRALPAEEAVAPVAQVGQMTFVNCDKCCNGDRCDNPKHFDRPRCPYCKGSGKVASPAPVAAEAVADDEMPLEYEAILAEFNEWCKILSAAPDAFEAFEAAAHRYAATSPARADESPVDKEPS